MGGNIFLFDFKFNVKSSLLRILQILIDLKSTISEGKQYDWNCFKKKKLRSLRILQLLLFDSVDEII